MDKCKSQADHTMMKEEAKVPKQSKHDNSKLDNQDVSIADTQDVTENKEGTVANEELAPANRLRFGIENILQQGSSKTVKTEERIKETLTVGLSSLSGYYNQLFTLQRSKTGTCYPYCQELFLPFKDVGSAKSHCNSELLFL
jgi:hypothetical protein